MDQVTILGIIFKYDMDEDTHYHLNFAAKILKVRDICSTWMNRTLSMKGRVLLISSLMTSILQYPCSYTITPTRLLLDYKKIITDFFLNDKRGKVAYKVLIQEIQDGGIRLPDLPTRIQSTHLYWIKFIWENRDSIMACVLKSYLHTNNVHELILCKTDLTNRLPAHCLFLRAIFSTWAKLHIHKPSDETLILKELIWHNDFIQIQ